MQVSVRTEFVLLKSVCITYKTFKNLATIWEQNNEMGAEPGRRFLKQAAAKLEPVIVAFFEIVEHWYLIRLVALVGRNFFIVRIQ